MVSTQANTQPSPLASPVHRRTVAITAAAGLAMFGVSFGGWSEAPAPAPGSASAAEIRRYAADNAGPLQLWAASSIVGAALLVVFVAGLAQLVRQNRRDSVLPGVILVCGGIVAVQSLLHSAAGSVFAFSHEMEGVSDATVVTRYDIAEFTEYLGSFVLCGSAMVLVASFSYVALRSRLMARWVSWVGLLLAAVGAALVLPFLDIGEAFLIVLFGWWLWPLAVGIALGVRWLRTR
jgi:hypothetical protein